jgi:hypothetical protein
MVLYSKPTSSSEEEYEAIQEELVNQNITSFTLRKDTNFNLTLEVNTSDSALINTFMVNLGFTTEIVTDANITSSTTKVVSADVVVNNSNTLVDIDDLKVELPASRVSRVELTLITNGTSAANLKFTFAAISGATGHYAYNQGNQQAILFGSELNITQNGNDRLVSLVAIVQTSTDGGVLTPQFAQNVAQASDTKIEKGSHIKVRDVGPS